LGYVAEDQRATPKWSPRGTCPSIARELVSLRLSPGFQHPEQQVRFEANYPRL